MIIQDVCDFCNQHLEANQEAFANPKLKLIYDDAKAQLQQCEGTFDVIIADLADPVYGGPCYQVLMSYIQQHTALATAQTLMATGVFKTTILHFLLDTSLVNVTRWVAGQGETLSQHWCNHSNMHRKRQSAHCQ